MIQKTHFKPIIAIFLLMAIVLLPSAFAWTSADFRLDEERMREETRDGIEEFTTLYGSYVIERREWFDPLGLWTRKTIKEIVLEENTEICGTECLAEGRVYLHEQGKIFEDIEWKRSFDGGNSWVDWNGFTNYRLFIENKNRFVQQPIFKTICENITEIDKTRNETRVCRQIKDGVKTIDKGEWEVYDWDKTYSEGEYRWRLEGSKKNTTILDWIFVSSEERLSEWAVWGGVIGVGGVQANVTLNSPLNNSIAFFNPITFNASVNITGGAGIRNVSLWTDRNGWGMKNTTLFSTEISAHNRPLSIVGGSETHSRGVLIHSNRNQIITRVTIGSGGTNLNRVLIRHNNGTIIQTATISSLNATFNTPLLANTFYRIEVDNSGGTLNTVRDLGSGSSPYPFNNNNINFIRESLNGADAGGIGLVWNIRTIESINKDIGRISFQDTIPPGSTIWNVRACDTDGDCGFSPFNFTKRGDTTPPTINIISGNGTLNYGSLTQNHTLTFNLTDVNLNNLILVYNNTNRTLGESTPTIENLTFFNWASGQPDGIGEDCLQIWSTPSSTMNDLNCNSALPFLCERWNNGTFFLNTTAVTWAVANASCINQGTGWSLARIDNMTEMTSAGALCGNCWLNGYQDPTFPEPPFNEEWRAFMNNHIPLINGTYNFTFPLQFGLYNATIIANDTMGNIAILPVSWNYRIFENSRNFNLTSIVTLIETFKLNLTTNTPQIPIVYLVYNGTETLVTRTGTTEEHLFVVNRTMFNSGSFNFFWRIITSDGEVNSFISQQNVTALTTGVLVGGVCPVGLTSTMRFRFVDETNLSPLSGINLRFKFDYGINNATGLSSFGQLINVNEANFCLNITQSPTYFIGGGEIEYERAGYSLRRFYIFENTRATNLTTNITLHSLPLILSTSFLVEIRSPTLTPYSGVHTTLMRWYPSLNEYRVVEMGRTDDKGETIKRVEVENADYRIGVYQKNGTLIHLVNPLRMVCLTSPCSYAINIPIRDTDLFTEVGKIQADLSYDGNSVRLIYNDPTQKMETMSLRVYAIGGTRDRLICEKKGSEFTGILICDIREERGRMKALAIRTASPEYPLEVLWIDTLTTVFTGTFGLFIQFILMMILVFLGAINPIVSIILGLVSLLFGVLIFRTMTYPLFIGIAVLGGWIIYFMRRQGS